MNSQGSYKIAALSILGYSFIIGMQYLFEDSLFQWSSRVYIPALQKYLGTSGFVWNLAYIYSQFIGGGVLQIAFIVFVQIFYSSSIESAVVFIGLAFELCVNTLLKNFHHQARPFWDNYYQGTDGQGIKPVVCYAEFGNPSGHSICASYFAMYLFFAYIYKPSISNLPSQSISIKLKDQLIDKSDYDDNQQLLKNSINKNNDRVQKRQDDEELNLYVFQIDQNQNDNPDKQNDIQKQINCLIKTTYQKAIAFIVLTVGYLLMAFSRNILGVHSLNQVVYGALLGLWTVFTFLNLIKPLSINYIKKIKVMNSKELATLLSVVGIICLIFLLAIIVVYQLLVSNYQFQTNYAQNLLKCTGEQSFDAIQKKFHESNILIAGIAFVPFGVFSGLIYKSKVSLNHFHQIKSSISYKKNNIEVDICQKTQNAFKKIINAAILCIPGLILMVATKILDNQFTINPLVVMAFEIGLPSLWAAFIFQSGIQEILLYKLFKL